MDKVINNEVNEAVEMTQEVARAASIDLKKLGFVLGGMTLAGGFIALTVKVLVPWGKGVVENSKAKKLDKQLASVAED